MKKIGIFRFIITTAVLFFFTSCLDSKLIGHWGAKCTSSWRGEESCENGSFELKFGPDGDYEMIYFAPATAGNKITIKKGVWETSFFKNVIRLTQTEADYGSYTSTEVIEEELYYDTWPVVYKNIKNSDNSKVKDIYTHELSLVVLETASFDNLSIKTIMTGASQEEAKKYTEKLKEDSLFRNSFGPKSKSKKLENAYDIFIKLNEISYK